jgi:Uracil-DNA glycosylase
MTKHESLRNHYIKYIEDFHGKEIVLGSGNHDTRILLIGEAPGKDEVRMSKPFVGKAGKQLDEFLKMLEVEKDSIYITNAIKYRLSKVDEKTGRISNRPATREEIISSRCCLMNEIEIICPEYIVTLGNVPLKAVTGDHKINIGNLHGNVTNIDVNGKEYKLYALYHPASIIYNRSLKDIYIDDIIKLKSLLTADCI